jgi:Sigma-70, region 4
MGPNRRHFEGVRLPQLPARYRAPFVLCCLQGKSYREAVGELGCPEGTIASRLSWARKRLRSRMIRRGFALAGGFLGAGLCHAGAAADGVKGRLVQATLQAAVVFRCGLVAVSADDKVVWSIALDRQQLVTGGAIQQLAKDDYLAVLYGCTSDSGVQVVRFKALSV